MQDHADVEVPHCEVWALYASFTRGLDTVVFSLSLNGFLFSPSFLHAFPHLSFLSYLSFSLFFPSLTSSFLSPSWPSSPHHLTSAPPLIPTGEIAPAIMATLNISGHLIDFFVVHFGNDVWVCVTFKPKITKTCLCICPLMGILKPIQAPSLTQY